MKMSSFDINFENVKSLIKSSKQLQHKIKKELGLQSTESTTMREFNEHQVPTSRSQTQHIPVDCFKNETISSPKPNQAINSNKFPATKPQKVIKQKHSNSEAQPHVINSMTSYDRKPASVRTPNSGNYRRQIQVPVKVQSRNICSNLNENTLKASKTSLESKKLTSTSSNRLPLQRFVDSVNKNTNFSIEHPELELECSPEQTTLFPRRFKKAACDSPLKNEESINLVQAEVRPKQLKSIHPKAKIEKETWNGILMQNHVKKRPIPKSLKIKKNTAAQNALKDNINEARENIDIISSEPAKGLFNLHSQSEQSDKKKKCNIQRFPVLYIRPQCRVQKLASISLQGDIEGDSKLTTAGSSSPGNVKYFVCKHEDIDTSLAKNETINQAERRECQTVSNSKFYKPLEFVDLPEILSSSGTQSSKISTSSSAVVSFTTSSFSVDNLNPSTSSNDIDPCIDPPLRNTVLIMPPAKHNLNSPKNRREVHVQTENKSVEEVSTNTTSSFQTPLPEATAAVLQMGNNSVTKLSQSVAKNAEDDIIAKIFERILNDLPDVLQSFKTRNKQTSPDCPLSPPSQENKEYPNQTQQGSTINDESIKIQPQFAQIQSKLQEEGQELPKQSCVEQEETNAIHWEKLNLEKQIHPTNEEIKRAAKMFIDSLKTGDTHSAESSDEEKALTSSLSHRQKAVRKSYFKTREFKSARLKHYTSSESCRDLSFTSKNIKNKNHKVTQKQFSYSSTSSSSSSSSSDLDSESECDMRSIENNDDSDMSFGEVKSLGEV